MGSLANMLAAQIGEPVNPKRLAQAMSRALGGSIKGSILRINKPAAAGRGTPLTAPRPAVSAPPLATFGDAIQPGEAPAAAPPPRFDPWLRRPKGSSIRPSSNEVFTEFDRLTQQPDQQQRDRATFLKLQAEQAGEKKDDDMTK